MRYPECSMEEQPTPAYKRTWLGRIIAILAIGITGCSQPGPKKMTFMAAEPEKVDGGIAGAWRARITFRTGALAAIRDLEFLYVFNAGGTMTESSNYDGAPPVPPAYGVWHKLSPTTYEAKYTFFVTKPPAQFSEITAGGGWMPAGHGVLTEHITLATNGNSYKATIVYEPVGLDGKTVEGGGEGEVSALRMDF
jgi:hypothetical protein